MKRKRLWIVGTVCLCALTHAFQAQCPTPWAGSIAIDGLRGLSPQACRRLRRSRLQIVCCELPEGNAESRAGSVAEKAGASPSYIGGAMVNDGVGSDIDAGEAPGAAYPSTGGQEAAEDIQGHLLLDALESWLRGRTVSSVLPKEQARRGEDM